MQPKVTKGSGWGQPFSQMGRLGTVLVLLAGACIGYLASSSSHSSSSGPTAGARLQELLGCWHAPGLSSPGQASVLQDKLTYKHYYIATSTIPGAGLGVFARHDMPKGFIWNVEDAQPGSVLNLTRAHWDSISHVASSLETAGVHDHAFFELVSFIRRYSYYCHEVDLLMVSLTASTLTNHATPPAASGSLVYHGDAAGAGVSNLSTDHHRARQLFAASSTATDAAAAASALRQTVPGKFVPTSVSAWPHNEAAAAKMVASLRMPAPSLLERCVLSRTQRALKAGEELMEDYATYNCPWPGCNSPTVGAARRAGLSTG